MATARSDPVCNVSWINRSDTFAHGIESLYKNQHQFDLKIMTKDGGELQAHRIVTSIASSTIREKVKGLKKTKPRECFWDYFFFFFA